jgi:ribosomal protein S18 acetylase RimI-like enzyme
VRWLAKVLLSARVTASTVRIVRASPGLVWRAFDADSDGDQVIGSVTAFLRPDDRWFVNFDSASRTDSYGPLLAAVARNTGSDLYASVDEKDIEAQGIFARLGFTVNRRESNYVIPTDPQVTGLHVGQPDGIVIISAANACEDEMRLLDDALRQDVPGTVGWRWDPGDFHEETFDSQFDPATYLIAIDTASGDFAGLVRVWNSPGRPRLGLIAVLRPYRRRGLASALLARAFGALHERGVTEVTAEVDETNSASLSLMLRLGASREGGTIEIIKPMTGSRGQPIRAF